MGEIHHRLSFNMFFIGSEVLTITTELIINGVKIMRILINNNQGGNWPSTTGNPSGGGRDNNPPKGK